MPAPASADPLADDQLALHAAGAMAGDGAVEGVRALLQGHGDGRGTALADHLTLVAPDRYRVPEAGGVAHPKRDLALLGMDGLDVEREPLLGRAQLVGMSQRTLRRGAVGRLRGRHSAGRRYGDGDRGGHLLGTQNASLHSVDLGPDAVVYADYATPVRPRMTPTPHVSDAAGHRP